MSEPIQCRCEVDEAEEGLGEFFVTGGDAAVCLDPAEEVFHLMALPVVATEVAGRVEPIPSRRDAGAAAVGAEAVAKGLGVKAFVGHHPTVTSAGQQREHRVLVMPGATVQADGYGPTARINQGGEFGIQTAFGAPHRLGGLPTCGIGTMLMELDTTDSGFRVLGCRIYERT